MEKLLFSGTNQLKKISQCKDNCVSIRVKGKKVRMILRSYGESLEKRYDFSRNKVSKAQFADLLRLKIILFRKEYKKKIEKKIEKKLKTKALIKLKNKAKLKNDKIKSDLDLKINEKKEEEKKEKDLDLDFKNKMEEKLEKELYERIKIILENELESKLSSAKEKLKEEIRIELKNERLKKQYNELMLAGNLNIGIKKDELAFGGILEYKSVDNNKVMSYSASYLIGEELNNTRTDFILLQLAIGHKFNLHKNINIELMFGGFSTIVNLLDNNKEWFFAWDTTGGVLSSLNLSFLITQNWGFSLKSDFFLFMVNYRNTENDGIYGNRNMSVGFYLGSFLRF